jgi:hypothetical protein
MIRNYLFILLAFLLTTSVACDKNCDQTDTGDLEYMVFGHFYGECGGEGCVETYKIEDQRLFEDTLDLYPYYAQPAARSYIPLPDDKYELVKDLVAQFPDELYAESNHVIGQPDAGDWGGVYVEIKFFNDPSHSGFWLLDQMESNMPQVYNEFVDKINEKIALINQ